MEGSCGTHGYEKIAFMVLAREPEDFEKIYCLVWEDNITTDFQETG
jgi:hypothetical protein